MIAFARAVNSNDYGVFAIKPDGTGLWRLTGAGSYFNPAWRPQRH